MEKPVNPFLLQAYYGPSYFCDRQSETSMLLHNIEQNQHTICFAQRRLGKTALIQHVFHKLKKSKATPCIYLDIYASQNLRDFTNQLANSIYQVFPETKGIGKKFREAIRLLRPVLSVDPLTGAPQLSLDISKPEQYERTIPQLLSFLDKQKTRTVIAIDEFQQILSYPEKNVEALLRTAIQPLRQVSFLFCGSNQAMMHEIFNSAKRPFYASARQMHMDKIAEEDYAAFISKHFRENGIRISEESLQLILSLTFRHTYYTQYLCHEVFATKNKTIQPEQVWQALKRILTQNEGTYFQYRNLLTGAQWQLLKAMALEERVEQPYARHFIEKHRLGTAALVKRSLDSLLTKEMLYYNSSVEKPYYEVYDKLLLRWLQNK